MKLDYLHKQIRKILDTVRFQERLVLGMGSGYNIWQVQKYLNCYDIQIKGILDNSPHLTGTWQNGLKTFRPEQLLQPFNDKALILIFSPKYAGEMAEQLKSMGYQQGRHFIILKDHRTPEDNDSGKAFRLEKRKALRGLRIYRDLKDRYGQDISVFIVRGATGDVFFNGLYLGEYLRKKQIRNYVLAGDAKGLKKVAALFDIQAVEQLSYEDAEALQQCYKFWRKSDITDLFMWQYSMHINRCQTRMHRQFNFLDTYTYYIYRGLVDKERWQKPRFEPLSGALREKYAGYGMTEGRTVLVAPFAYSVRDLPEWFWDDVARGLKARGYRVFASINPALEINPFEEMKSVFFPFSESDAILRYAGNFLALRSGLCDIVAQIPCRQVILYPDEMSPLDYRVHRSDLVFSGFKAMGFGTDGIVEIGSPAIRDLVSPAVDYDRLERETLEKLTEQVLCQFPAVPEEG